MLKSIALAAVLALTGGGLAMAQNQTGAALVDALFAQIERDVLQGYPSVASVRGALAKETTADHTFNAVAGRSYIVIGVCDEGCTDLDLGVYNGAGTVMGSDVEEDDTPAVIFEAGETGRHQITVLMAVCAARCNYGVKVYEQQ